jgi:Zn/Cd-binding protein ZinT|tara:strand:- start:297 stop:647 length:351 start_codon:yes stop_codon:yes gene_type:complete
MELQKIIKDWVLLDNRYKKILDDNKEIRNEKKKLNDKIFAYFNNNNYTTFPKINISDGKLEFVEQKQYDVLTYTYLQKCLNEYFNDTEEVMNIMTYIKKKRDYSINKLIKRTYKNN